LNRMKPFHFSLQAVATVRENEESLAREAYACAVRQQRQIAARQQEVESSIHEGLAEQGEVLNREGSAAKAAQIQAALRVLRARLQEISAEAVRFQATVDEKWRLLLSAQQRCQTLAKVRDRQVAVHQAEEARQVQLGLDEMAALRASGGLGYKTG